MPRLPAHLCILAGLFRGEISPDLLETLPKTIKMDTGFNGETIIVYHRLSPLLFFFLPFTAIWSGGSMIGIYGTQFWKCEFDLGQSLFGIPFLLGTIVLLMRSPT